MSPEIEAEVVRMRSEENLLHRQIADRVGCSVSLVGQILKKHNASTPDARRVEWPIEQMRHWYEVEGLTIEQIGAKLGQSRVATNKALKRHGIPLRRRGPKDGELHTGWKGGRHLNKDGYIEVYQPNHPFARKGNRRVLEHRLVMEQMIGRYLEPGEVVHHKNGDKQDNRPENLELFANNGDHLAATLVGQCPKWTEDGKRRIQEGVRKAVQQRASRRRSTPDDPASTQTIDHPEA